MQFVNYLLIPQALWLKKHILIISQFSVSPKLEYSLAGSSALGPPKALIKMLVGHEFSSEAWIKNNDLFPRSSGYWRQSIPFGFLNWGPQFLANIFIWGCCYLFFAIWTLPNMVVYFLKVGKRNGLFLTT